MTRIVFDTNVIVSALLFNESVPGQAFFRALDQGIILTSGPLVRELNQVLNRRKFDRYISPRERDQFLATLIRDTHRVEITSVVSVCRDPRDNQVLELALSGNATCIVTSDDDLLVLHPFRDVAIVAPAEFLLSQN